MASTIDGPDSPAEYSMITTEMNVLKKRWYKRYCLSLDVAMMATTPLTIRALWFSPQNQLKKETTVFEVYPTNSPQCGTNDKIECLDVSVEPKFTTLTRDPFKNFISERVKLEFKMEHNGRVGLGRIALRHFWC